jgi:hypothetical protein
VLEEKTGFALVRAAGLFLRRWAATAVNWDQHRHRGVGSPLSLCGWRRQVCCCIGISPILSPHLHSPLA